MLGRRMVALVHYAAACEMELVTGSRTEGVYSLSPRSCCSACLSCTDGTTVFSEGAWDSSSVDSDDDDEGEADVSTVEQHLEDMNFASDDLNAAQKELASLYGRRRTIEHRWAAKSASLVRVLSAESLRKARLCVEQERCCQVAEDEVHAASLRFTKAAEAGASIEALAEHSKAHALRLRQFQEAERCLEQALKMVSNQGCGRAVTYLEEESENYRQIASIEASIEEITRRLVSAKEKYQAALAGLESLSEAVHRSRSRRTTRALTVVSTSMEFDIEEP